MGHKIKLIAFDLDDTLLTREKKLTPENFKALTRAAEAGVKLVPTTGRFWGAVPEIVKAPEFKINYSITANGAEIFDTVNLKVISEFKIPLERALNIMRIFEDLGVVYDAFIDGKGMISQKNFEKLKNVALDEYQFKLLHDLRTPVEDVKIFAENLGHDVQKVQLFTLDKNLRGNLLNAFKIVLPLNSVSSSVPNNVEINDIKANKGDALKKLAEYLGFGIENVLAFGDGLNDISMIKNAGIGVAMNNAVKELKDVADYITLNDCDNSGVAEGIYKFCDL